MSEKALVYKQRILPMFTALQTLLNEADIPYIFAVHIDADALDYHLSLASDTSYLPPLFVHDDTVEAVLVPDGYQAAMIMVHKDGSSEGMLVPEDMPETVIVSGDGETFDGNAVDFHAQS